MSNHSKPIFAGLVAMAAAFALTSCGAISSVTVEADYPAYETPASLVSESAIVVEATVLDKEPTILLPRYEGDTPEENPYLGATEEERQRAVDEDGGLPGEAVILRVDVVHRGGATPGDEVVFIQTGGVMNGVKYDFPEESDLQPGSRYLLFGMDSVDGAFTVLGGSAGAFIADDDRYIATSDAAPVTELTIAEVKALLSGSALPRDA